MKNFIINWRYTDGTDSQLHKSLIKNAQNEDEACKRLKEIAKTNEVQISIIGIFTNK